MHACNSVEFIINRRTHFVRKNFDAKKSCLIFASTVISATCIVGHNF